MHLTWQQFEQRPRWQFLLMGLGMLAVLVAGDLATGPNVTLGPFYLVPICFVAWFAGPLLGTVMAMFMLTSFALVQIHDLHIQGRPPPDWGMWAINYSLRLLFNIIVACVLPAGRDVGKRLERMVAERTAALHELAADLSAAEDAQRRQLAHDIHDALGQNLSLLRIHLESIARDLPERAAENGLQARLSAEVVVIDSLIQQTRTLTFDLYPPMLDDLGLGAALAGYADDFSKRTGTEASASQVGNPPENTLPIPVEHYLFRSVRELMTNAVNHGRARQIVITLNWQPESVRLTVDDDGVGFDDTVSAKSKMNQRRRGLGLAGIRQRLSAMGGQMLVESGQGQGTRVILQLPLAAIKAHNESLVHSL